MISRIYIHNFRCLENFELSFKGNSSALIIGKNGSGKTTVAVALEILQRIARGTNRVSDLITQRDLAQNRLDRPIRFEIEVYIDSNLYKYIVVFELPEGFKELRVSEETLFRANKMVFNRSLAQVQLSHTNQETDSRFSIDWHLVALPIIQEKSQTDPIFLFKQWLRRMLILRPVPGRMRGDSEDETLQPDIQVNNFGAWFSGLLAYAPAAYSEIDGYLKQVMPDLKDIKNPAVGVDVRSLQIQFSNGNSSLILPFQELSDGEKCFMICALVLAANKAYGPVLCFWDEPDNFLALPEVQHFIRALRQAFHSNGLFIATSHNPEVIRSFSPENTLVFSRRSHAEPTQVHYLNEIGIKDDIINAITLGALDL